MFKSSPPLTSTLLKKEANSISGRVSSPQIKLTVTKRMHAQIQARADELGTTKADYLRMLVLDDLRGFNKLTGDSNKAKAEMLVVEQTVEKRKERRIRVNDEDVVLENEKTRVSFDDLLKLI